VETGGGTRGPESGAARAALAFASVGGDPVLGNQADSQSTGLMLWIPCFHV